MQAKFLSTYGPKHFIKQCILITDYHTIPKVRETPSFSLIEAYKSVLGLDLFLSAKCNKQLGLADLAYISILENNDAIDEDLTI